MQRRTRRWWLVPALVLGLAPMSVLWAEGGKPAEGDARADKPERREAQQSMKQAQSERRRIDSAWVKLSFDRGVDNATLLRLREGFYEARQAQEQAFQQARASGDWQRLNARMGQITQTLDGVVRQAVPGDTYQRLFGREGGQGDSPEATAGPRTGPRDGEGGAKPGPREGE